MRGALTDATLPVVMRRTCVCPSCLLAAAVNCLVIIWFRRQSRGRKKPSL